MPPTNPDALSPLTGAGPMLTPPQEFASRLAFMMTEAGQLGLYRTMHKIHDAVREIGWEIADSISKEKRNAKR